MKRYVRWKLLHKQEPTTSNKPNATHAPLRYTFPKIAQQFATHKSIEAMQETNADTNP